MSTVEYYCEDCEETLELTAAFVGHDEDGFDDFQILEYDGHDDHDMSLPR